MAARVRAVVAVFLALGVAGCGGSGGSTAPQPSGHTTSPAPTRAPAVCPPPGVGSCLGPLAAGTYLSASLQPALTVTVPDGWANWEDYPGNFLLLPPTGNLAGVDPGTSDFLGIYPRVAPPKGCKPGSAPGVPPTVAGFRRWIGENDAFATPQFHDTSVGGLDGFVVDLRLADGYDGSCPYGNGKTLAPLIFGYGPSAGVEHNVFTAASMTRLYIVDNGGKAMAIELVDIKDAGHVDAMSKVVDTFEFDE